MKIKILLLFIFISTRIFSQEKGIGFEYSFEIEIANKEMAEKLKENSEFQFSKSFNVFYTEKGILRFIEKSNNYIQSSIFNNKNNELIIFDSNGIVTEKSGDYNKPKIKSVNSESEGIITFKTASGIYNYYYNPEKFKINSSNYNNLGEHCFYEFIKGTGVIPEKIIYEFGIMKFIMKLIKPIELNSNEIELLNEIVDNPNKKGIKKFINFIGGK